MSDRTAKQQRTTKETDISVSLNLDGTGKSVIDTSVRDNELYLKAL